MAKDFVFRIKPGDPLPPITPSGYRLMVDESTGSIKMLSADGNVVNPNSSAVLSEVPSVITNNYGLVEYTYVNQTVIEGRSIINLSGKTITLIDRVESGYYIDVDKVVCEISVKTPFTITGGPVDLGLEFTGMASGAIGNIDISFLTATDDSFVVLHTNKTSSGGTLPTSTTSEPSLTLGLSSPATINQGGDGTMHITVFYKIREFGALY